MSASHDSSDPHTLPMVRSVLIIATDGWTVRLLPADGFGQPPLNSHPTWQGMLR